MGAGLESRMLFLSRLGPGQYQKTTSGILSMSKILYDIQIQHVQFTGLIKHLQNEQESTFTKKFSFQKMPLVNNLQYQHCPKVQVGPK